MSERELFRIEDGSVSLEMLLTMHPAITLMITWTNLWCYSHGIIPFWTSWKRTPEQNKALGATTVHEWRAADLSLKKEHGWTIKLRQRYAADFKERFHKLGAVVQGTDGRLYRRPIIRHDSGHGDHFHLQCSPNADVFHERGDHDYTVKRRKKKDEQNQNT
jgi:hypothetical protein